MKITLVSDLHLEFCAITLPGDPDSTLLLAGDIVPAALLRPARTDKNALRIKDRARKFFSQVSESYKAVFYIMGNHEHYSGYIEESQDILKDFTRDLNITLLEKQSVPLTANTRLFGATLWTNFYESNPLAIDVARQGMNDFRGSIRHNRGGIKPNWTPEESVIEHSRILVRLKSDLLENMDKDYLVMTHHCPSFKSISERYSGDWMNYAFASDLSDFMLDHHQIKHWVHGHTHDSFDYKIGDTRVMCNPRGYTHYEHIPPENAAFNPTFTFEVS